MGRCWYEYDAVRGHHEDTGYQSSWREPNARVVDIHQLVFSDQQLQFDAAHVVQRSADVG